MQHLVELETRQQLYGIAKCVGDKYCLKLLTC